MPLNLVLDALSVASHNVAALMTRNLEVPPVPVETVKKQDNNQAENPNQEIPKGFRLPKNIVEVFEVWKVFVEQERNQTNEAYVVLSADHVVEGYQQGEWENVEYRGFYTTLEEAKNEINGYLR
ncbi:MAG: hypothetical protein K0R18_461 [Bacillales bacterium]|nr:hypothetical protein [Bacillales bacterium]